MGTFDPRKIKRAATPVPHCPWGEWKGQMCEQGRHGKNFGSACFKLLQIRMGMPMSLMILMLMLPLPLPPPLPPPLLPPLPFYFTIVSITRITTS